MEKRKIGNVLIFLAYCVPWGFLALWGAMTFDTLWGYGLALAVTGVLAWYCGREKKLSVAVTGNAVASVVSFVLILGSAFLWGNWQLELFGPLGWTVLVLALTIPVQVFSWNRYWGFLTAFVVLLAALIAYLYSLQLRM